MCASIHAQYESRLDQFSFCLSFDTGGLPCRVSNRRENTCVSGCDWPRVATSPDAPWTTGIFLLFSAEIPLEDDYPNGLHVYLMSS